MLTVIKTPLSNVLNDEVIIHLSNILIRVMHCKLYALGIV